MAAQAASGSAAQCALILGHDLYGNDLLGPAGKPLPLPVSGPAECCDKCSTKAVGAEPKGRCAAWSYNHGTSTCWMKTGHGNKTGCQPNELCPNVPGHPGWACTPCPEGTTPNKDHTKCG